MLKFLKKHYSNIFFVLVIGLLLYPKSKTWILRQISFSPRLENTEKRVKVASYDWSLQGITTENYNFNQGKGKVVLVNFWATWCVPCIAEMPSLQTLYDDYGDKVDFLLVTSDTKDKVIPFMKEHNFSMPIYNQMSQAPKEFATRTIPKTFLLDKKGNIVIEAARADWDTKKTRKLLDQLINE